MAGVLNSSPRVLPMASPDSFRVRIQIFLESEFSSNPSPFFELVSMI